MTQNQHSHSIIEATADSSNLSLEANKVNLVELLEF